MLRRNFDFIAVMVVAGGIAIMQSVPRFEQRVDAAGIQYQTADAGQKCVLAERILSRIAIRRSE